MPTFTSIHWFRQDLRVADNPALFEACNNGTTLPIYIYDDSLSDSEKLGGASKVWLHNALKDLNTNLGGTLSIYYGNAQHIIERLCTTHAINNVYWNRCYEPGAIKRDTAIKKWLKSNAIGVHSYNGSLLWEPWTINKKDGSPYKVFTPYYRKGCLQSTPPRSPLPTADITNTALDAASLSVDALALLPSLNWGDTIASHWDISEDGAHSNLVSFIDSRLNGYSEGRNIPEKNQTSLLSPYLHFGLISPHQIWEALKHVKPSDDSDTFCSELGWREFSYTQMYYNPDLQHVNLQKKFNHFPWNDDPDNLKAWQTGQTGIPIVDAGMRELWQTGYMHNRVRMIVGSFLVKNLRLHWHHGERWFWDCLVDADLASNSASWQWIAGCGADAAPYFRIFNPVTQSEKFDSNGAYIRKYVPELAELPDKYLFKPWEAPTNILFAARVHLGKTYPQPIVDIKESRKQALEAFQSLKTM